MARKLIVLALGLGLVLAVTGAQAAPGALDPSFGSDGRVVTKSTLGNGAQAVALQRDGKIVATGPVAAAGATELVFGLARYKPNGALDSSFGSGGIVKTITSSPDDVPRAVALQRDGRIIVAGVRQTENVGSGYRFMLARYTRSGTLDSTFGSRGIVTTAVGGRDQDYASGIAIQPNGKILVAGTTLGPSLQTLIALVRYNPNGSLDTTFGSNGKVTTTIGSDAVANALALQPDGRIVVAGSSGEPRRDVFALARYNGNGALDPTFGSGGIVTTEIGGADDAAYAVGLQRDGKIVAAGRSRTGTQDRLAIVRYTSRGALDSGFGSGGAVTTAFGSGSANAYSLGVQRNGKIVAGGTTYDGSRAFFALARYGANGRLDSRFGSGGTVTTSVGPSDAFGWALALQPDGRIVLAGASTDPPTGGYRFALARYLGDPTCVVPGVRGKTLRRARQSISRARCGLGRVSKAFSRTIGKGRVISQAPAPGKVLLPGGKVSLRVSKGKRR